MKVTPRSLSREDRAVLTRQAQTLELWGGAECTVNRVGDAFFDQLHRSGHHDRLEDLDLVAALGVTAWRLPILWERVAPDDPGQCDWHWSDTRVERLLSLGVRPIAGLVHHGSGPDYTSLIDAGFAPGLARYARAAAERYPGVTDWTPVNEPLTTARFAALYGHWYPHLRDEGQFWTALINQIDGTRLAMEQIRAVNPGARLIQTEDMGRTFATAPLAEQAAYDNARRWMSLDLLCGRVTPDHPMWRRLCRFGLEDRLRAVADAPCPPDVIGINHYLTSDRFLDHRTSHYPNESHGRNTRRAFADVAAIRVLSPPPAGLRGVLRETWERYGLPIAVTEVHNGCTREEQLRWIDQAWTAAQQLRQDGVDLRAVTIWALFGSHGWDTLLTGAGSYEPGVFDTRGGSPRPTALARFLKSRDPADFHPAIAPQGWWQRDIRLLHPVTQRPAPLREHLALSGSHPARQPILILGASGTLGQALAAACEHRNIAVRLVGRAEMDLSDPAAMGRTLTDLDPSAVINAAGWVRVDDAEVDCDGCMAVNADGTIALAKLCAERGIPSVAFSSDLVFADCAGAGWVESDAPAPLNAYGRSKHRMEQAIAGLPGEHLVIRTAAFFSPHDQHNFAISLIRDLREGRQPVAAEDYMVSPTYVPDLCNAVLDLVIDGEQGIWHLSNGEGVTWLDFARAIAAACGHNPDLIVAACASQLGWRAQRPANSTLLSERGSHLPSLGSAIARFARDLD